MQDKTIRNVVKRDSKKGKHPLNGSDTPTPKRKVIASEVMRRYPIGPNSSTIDNPETIAELKKGILNELSKSKPRDSVLLPLMQSTFGERRMFILSEEVSVESILKEYPALSRPAIVRNIMIIILHTPLSIMHAD